MRLLIIVCCTLVYNICFSQNIKLTGKVTDTLKTPLPYANIIAEPKDESSLKFTITNEEGNYELTLEKNKSYILTVSYLGYSPKYLAITATENKEHHFVLKSSTETLDEVTLNYTPPVVVKEDTIVYRTNIFKTGNERKLREVLKKLPGVDVDRSGNVTVMGKKVTKVLVEGKQFFTGNSKLAVNNIPADAVDKVEVLDNYNEVAMLKGLEDSEEMAMNIKLKEDKKRFAFGDIEVGSNIDKRYLIHPNIFYYSPKTSINTIGDFNNTGKKSFTFNDYVDFEGGWNKVFSKQNSYTSLRNDAFSKFLTNRDYRSSRSQFLATNITKEINSKTELSSYIIWSKNKTTSQNIITNNYISNTDLLENRVQKGLQHNHFGIGKLDVVFKPNKNSQFKVETNIKVSTNLAEENITSTTIDNNAEILNKNNGNNTSLSQNINWYKRFNRRHTISTALNYTYNKTTPESNWLSDNTILEGLIPIINEDVFNVTKNNETESHSTNLAFKHYWALNNLNHIYTTIGYSLALDTFCSKEFQTLNDDTINDFYQAGFGNNLKLDFNTIFLGLQYKFKIGDVTYKPGIFYHNYFWNTTQSNQNLNKHKAVFLPEFTMSFNSKLKNRVTFKYALKARFPQISQLANRLTLLSFNNIYQGNQELKNELYHTASLNLNRFSIYRDIYYNFSISFKKKDKSIKNAIELQGIDYVSRPFLVDFEDKTWNFNGNFRKGIGNYMFKVRSNLTLSKFENLINDQILANKSATYSYGGGFETRFKNAPNLELSYNRSTSNYKTYINSKFSTNRLSFFFESAFLKHFIFKANYNYEDYKNQNSKTLSTFDIANASLFYQKEDSPWGFEMSANNIFDVKFKQRNSFSNILVADQKTFILPRIVMFKIAYKL